MESGLRLEELTFPAGASMGRRFKRWCACLFVCVSILNAAELRVDHATVAGRDLKVMRAALAHSGIRSEYGGPHANHATEMALVSFPDGSYLELIALQPHAETAAAKAHYWSSFIEGNAGPCAWAVRSPDVGVEAQRLRQAGVEVAPPSKSGRTRPDGVRLEWETAKAGPGATGTFFPFLIRDFTPRLDRAWPNGKPNSPEFAGVARVVIAVRDLQAASQRYIRAYRLPAPALLADPSFGAKLAIFAGTPVVLAAPRDGRSWLATRLEKFGEAPCAFVLMRGPKAKVQVKPGGVWMGKQVSWFDEASLGWRLGVE